MKDGRGHDHIEWSNWFWLPAWAIVFERGGLSWSSVSVVKEELIERRSYDAAFGALNARVVVAY